jgi:hypothetical protein
MIEKQNDGTAMAVARNGDFVRGLTDAWRPDEEVKQIPRLLELQAECGKNDGKPEERIERHVENAARLLPCSERRRSAHVSRQHLSES